MNLVWGTILLPGLLKKWMTSPMHLIFALRLVLKLMLSCAGTGKGRPA